jgi:hypothetical protein
MRADPPSGWVVISTRYFQALRKMSDADRRWIVEAALDQIRVREPKWTGVYLGGLFYRWDGAVIAVTFDEAHGVEHGPRAKSPEP